MNGANFNYEQKFFLENYEVSGVVGIDGGYQINEEPLNVLGHGYFDSLVNAPLQGNFSIERSLITRDPLLNYTGEVGFNGGIYYKGTSFDFVSGYLEEYSVSCSVGAIPSVSAQISVFGNIGGRSRTLEQNKIKNYNTTLHHTETGITKQYIETGILTTGIVADQEVVKLDAVEWLDYSWYPLSGDHPIPATEVIKPEEEGEIIQIPDQGSIYISGFGTETNRVQSFTYTLATPREPIYTVGRDRPVEVQSIPPYEVNAEILLHIDDYEAKNVFDYLIKEKSPHKKDLIILVNNSDDTSTIASYNIPNARLVAENISASANEQLEISLSYKGYYNFLDESIISGNLLFGGADEIGIGADPDRECREPTVQVFKPQAKPATNHTQACFTLNWKGHVIDHGYELDVSKEDPYFNQQNKILDRMHFSSNSNEQILYSYELCGLDAGTVYYYRIRSKNEHDVTSEWSNVVETITIPDDSEINNFSDCQDNPNFGFRLNWNSSKGATHYLLDLSTSPSFDSFALENFIVNQSNYLAQNLSAGTEYYSRVKAVNGSGSSDYSKIFKNHTRPPKPTNVQLATISDSSFSVSWNASKLNEGYMVSVFPAGSSSPLSSYNRKKTNQTSMIIKGLDKGKSYSVVLHVENDCGETSGTSPKTIALIPGIISNITASQCTFYGFSLSWQAIEGATSYEIEYGHETDEFNRPLFGSIKTSLSNGYTFTGLTAGTKYFYRIKSVNSSGKSDASDIFNKTTIPPAPLLLESPTTEQDSILIKWSPSSGADSYEVDVSLESNSFLTNLNGYNSVAVTSTSLKVENLSAGQNYIYRVRALNDCGTSENSSTGTDCTAPSTPTNLSASNLTPNSFDVSWSSAGAGVKYIFDLSTSDTMSPLLENYANLEVAGTTISVSNLEENSEHYFRVRSSDGKCGKSPYTLVSSEITASNSSLKGLKNPINCTFFGFTASWIKGDNTTEYEFNLSTNSSFSSFVNSYDTAFRTSSNSLVISNLTPGTRYYYRIKGYNQYGSTEYSSSKQVLIAPSAPTVSSSEISANGFVISNTRPISTASYEIDISKSSNFSTFITGFRSKETSDSSIEVGALSPSTTYYIRVRGKNSGCGLSQNSSTHSVTTAAMPAIPSSPATSACTYFGITIAWNSASDASSYNVVVSENSTFSNFISGFDEGHETTSNSVTITDLNAGKLYHYKIRSKNDFGFSNFTSVGTFLTYPQSPVFNISSTTISSISLSWSPVLSAKKYFVHYAEKNGSTVGSYTRIETSETFHTISSLKSDQLYSIYLTSENNGCGESEDSSITEVRTSSVPGAVSGLTKVICSTSGFSVSWNSLSAAQYYKVSLFSGSSLVTFLNAYTNSANFLNLDNGIAYTVKVQAANEHGLSLFSDPITITTKPPTPSSFQITSFSDSSVSVGWTASASATSYITEISSDSNFSTIIESKELTSTSYTFNSGIAQNSSYYVRVRASNSSCGEGLNSTPLVTTTSSSAPAEITNIQTADCTSSNSSFGFTIGWNSSANATSYEVNLSTNSNFSTFVSGFDTSNSTLTNNVVITGLDGGTQYYFRIKAKNKDASSNYSATENIHTIPTKLTGLEDTDLGCDGCADVQWDASPGATGYKIFVATDSNFSNTITDYGPKELSLSNSEEICNLDQGVIYYIKVLALNACGEGEASEIQIEMPPAVPDVRTSSQIQGSSFTANWSYPNGTNYFKFYLSEQNDMSSMVSGYDGLDVFTNSISLDNLTGTTYYFKVRAYSSAGDFCGESNVKSTTLIISAPTANGASSNNIDCSETGHTFSTSAASFTINWVNQSTASGYYVDLSENPDFTSFVSAEVGGVEVYLQNYQVSGSSSNSIAVSKLSAGTLFYYRIRSYNAEGQSLDSNIITVLTKPFRPSFTTTQSTSASSVTLNIIPTFSENVSNSSTSASDYNVKVYSDQALSTKILEDDISSTSIVVNNLLGGQEYYAIATASNASGDSCVSTTFSFSTSKSLLQEDSTPILQQNDDIILLEDNN